MKNEQPLWLPIARSYIGLKETLGPKHNKTIQLWLAKGKAWWNDDETPWCGTYVLGVFLESGLTLYSLPKAWYRAKDWLNWGTAIKEPAEGCVVIFDRKGGGHVGFVVGVDQSGNLMVLGGNQNNEVNVRPFSTDRVLGYKWPPGFAAKPRPLSLVSSDGKLSTNEA